MRLNSKGFTLIELIVVMAVFLLVIGAAIGIFLSIIAHQRLVLSEQQLLNQTSYVEEYMSKGLRMATKDFSGNCFGDSAYSGYTYLLTRQVNGFYTGIKFLNASNVDRYNYPICEEFYLDHSDANNSSSPLVLKEKETYYPYAQIGDEKAVDMTSKDLGIQSIRFALDGTTGCYGASVCPMGDQDPNYSALQILQPKVTIVLSVKLRGDSQEPIKTIQTTVSQRNLNAQ